MKSILTVGVVSLALSLCTAGTFAQAQLRANTPPVAIRQSATFHPERVLVRFKAGTSNARRQAAHRTARAIRVRRDYHVIDDLQLVDVPRGSVTDVVRAYRAQPDVLYAEPDYLVQAVEIPDDPDLPLLWGLQNVGQTIGGVEGVPGADARVVEAWNLWRGDSQFRIAVIDTGVDYTHPDLAANVWVNPGEIPGNGLDDDGNGYVDDIHGYDFYNNDGDPMDDAGHGTHVAGTIGAVGDNGTGVVGVNWSCRIVALKFLGAGGSGSSSDAILALQYALDNGIRVSNNSWGGGSFTQALYDTILASQGFGHLFVAAAGNSGIDIDVNAFYPAGYELDNIISVAATDNRDQLAGFSNFGAVGVELGAPGVRIYSTLPFDRYGYLNGTSMAAPHVAGVLGLMLSRTPQLTWPEARLKLLQTVRPVSALEGITVTGGVVDAAAAVGDCNHNSVDDDIDVQQGTSTDCNGNLIPDECETDCNGNGVHDDCDLAAGTSDDCNSNGIPDECIGIEIDCNGNLVPDACDIASGTSVDCTANAVPDECEPDCNDNAQADSCDIADATSMDCPGATGNAIPDECEPDCNGNATADSCDIAAGTSGDCTFNGIPDDCEPDCNDNLVADSCDVLTGDLPDCDTNGVPDECQLADGTSEDCNDNQVPDECEGPPLLFVSEFVSIDQGFLDSLTVAGYAYDLREDVGFPADLGIYHCLVLPNRNNLDFDEQVEAYLEEGGSVILFAHLYEWVASYNPIISAQDWSFRENTTVVEPSSPLVAELPTSSTLRGNAWGAMELREQAQIVMTWDDGEPMAMVMPFGNGRVVYFNDLNAHYYHNWWGDSGYGTALLYNALEWLRLPGGVHDCNANGVFDECDILSGTSADADGNGVPDECDPCGICSDGQFCNGLEFCGPSGVCVAGEGPCSAGDACDDIGDVCYRCTANADCDDGLACNGFETCNETGDCMPAGFPDCNENGQSDVCELEEGVDGDCNGDGVLDGCEIADGAAEDCNENAIPDWCEGPPRAFVRSSVVEQEFIDALVGAGYDVVHAQVTPPDFADFDVVLLDSISYPSDVDRLDDYIQNGGGWWPLAVSNGSILFTAEAHPVSGGADYALRTGTVVVVSENPLTEGLAQTSTLQGWSIRPTLKPGAEVSINWSDGEPMLISRSYGAGRVVFVNDLNAYYAWLWKGDVEYGRRLMRNILRFLNPSGGVYDCNGNGAFDSCDITAGTSSDANSNGVPDECDACEPCDDGLFCNGDEYCGADGTCQPGPTPCLVLEACDEESDQCHDCESGTDCDDGQYCNGLEVCEGNVCNVGADPCPGELCRESEDQCVQCLTDTDCDDGDGCNGSESCDVEGLCVPGTYVDCNGNGIDDPCDIDAETSNDCNGNDTPDECDIAHGASGDCDGDGEPDECEPDCNGNAAPDACDIEGGVSEDCNGSAVPDECELVGNDCNGNDAPDDCESDSDADGVIDVCDGCPDDPTKVAPGTCGCGNPDDDSDGDAVADCQDSCPGFDDTIDTDEDSVPNGCDRCEGFDDAHDADQDDVPDGCDACPLEPALGAPTEPMFELTCDDGVDNDCDGVIDAADGDCVCVSAEAPQADANGVPMCRYLSFVTESNGRMTAIRVRLADLPPPFQVFGGDAMWVSEPKPVSELGSLADNTPPVFLAATLQCTPHYADWSLFGAVHVYHELIVPNGEFDVQAIDAACSATSESDFSDPMVVMNARHGDVVGAFNVGANAWDAPDGSVDLTTDVVAVIDKFRSTPSAPSKPRSDVEPSTPDQLINISDAVQVIDAFRGLPYPYSPSGPAPPCP